MDMKTVSPLLPVSDQIASQDVAAIAAAGFKSIICSRTVCEGPDQCSFAEVESAANAAAMQAAYLPIVSGKANDVDSLAIGAAMDSLPKPVLASCRSGTRSATAWFLSEGGRGRPLPDIIRATKAAGYDMAGVVRRIANGGRTPTDNAHLHFQQRLTRVDGAAKTAWFARTNADGTTETVETGFDMIHVVPPQIAPECVRALPLGDAAGWVDGDPAAQRHKTLANIYALGGVTNASHAKTAAAARKQPPVLARNLLRNMGALAATDVAHDDHGSCRLTIERGKIVLAEFGYGGKLLPPFPAWLIDGTWPSRLAWLLKERILPPVCWKAMLRRREWMAKPQSVTAT